MDKFTPCNTTNDCLQADPNTVKHCYRTPLFSKNQFFCGCSSYFGWIGENCNEVSTFLLYQRIVFGIFIFWCSAVLILLLRTIFLNLLYDLWSKTNVSLASYSTLLSVISLFIYLSLRLRSFVNPNAFISITREGIVLSHSRELIQSDDNLK